MAYARWTVQAGNQKVQPPFGGVTHAIVRRQMLAHGLIQLENCVSVVSNAGRLVIKQAVVPQAFGQHTNDLRRRAPDQTKHNHKHLKKVLETHGNPLR